MCVCVLFTFLGGGVMKKSLVNQRGAQQRGFLFIFVMKTFSAISLTKMIQNENTVLLLSLKKTSAHNYGLNRPGTVQNTQG